MDWCMMGMQRLTLPEIVPQQELAAWRAAIPKATGHCPAEVAEFIEALADKLDDFIRIRYDLEVISGRDLLLANVPEVDGERVLPWAHYKTPVPYMVAADHRAAMFRIFRKKGKQGLIDFCRVKVKGTDLERCLRILDTVVFKEESADFRKVMADIRAASKLESEIV